MSSRLRSAAFLAVCLLCAGPSVAATFTVTNASDSGTNSLRWAINQANGTAGADTIAFNIAGAGVHTINLASALPAVSSTVVIDGSTQPGYATTPLIELNGAGAGAGINGLSVTGANGTVKALAINRFTTHGIYVTGNGNTVTACFIGTAASGAGSLANGHSGVWLAGANNVVGPGNVLSGNAVDGVRVDQAAASGNVIKGNRIGTNAAGNAALANGFNGIVLSNAASGTLIGGTTAADLNVISGNAKNGIGIASGATALIERNYIGLAADGAAALGNALDGVLVIDTPGITIGGTANGTFNIISGNGGDGVELRGDGTTNTTIQRNIIGLDLFGTLDRGNVGNGIFIDGADGTRVGGGPWGAGGNLISGNGGSGVYAINDVGGTQVQGNRIGTDYNGTAALANGNDGIRIDGGRDTVIGTTTAPNLVSGNIGAGIDLLNEYWHFDIVGNRVGTDASGTAALGNTSRGIWVRAASSGGTIGGTDHDAWTCNRACNLVAGNGGYGIQLGSNNYDDILVQGNFVGTNLAGTAALPNTSAGVVPSGGWGTIVGGEAAGAGNLISGNTGPGVDASSSSSLTVQGNRIGTNAGGTGALGNGGGIFIHNQKPHVTIGSSTHTAGVCDGGCNLISGNTGDGIRVLINDFYTSSNKLIAGNFIGYALNGATCVGNARDGVRMETGFSFALIGGPGALDGNRIGCNSGNGITQFNADDNYGIGYIGNSFSGNGGLAIDNGGDGVTPNDPDDADIWLENFPLLDAAISSGGTTTVAGRLDGENSKSYRVEFFASPACDASGYGEGGTLIGAASVSTDANGLATFSVPVGAIANGQSITATATIVAGSAPFIDYSTSEFSACITVRPPAPTPGNSGPVCTRQTLALTASAVAGASYAWTGPNGFSSNLQNPGITNATAAASGSYSVVASVNGVASAPATTSATVNACTLSINNPPAVGEGDSGTVPLTFTVSLSTASTQAVTVDWATADATAVAPGDYAPGSGTLTIPANATTATIARSATGDTLDESNETFNVNLSNASAGSIADAQGVGTITDDDAAPTVSIADKTCTEGNSGNTVCAFTISLGAISGLAVGGNYATASGGATPATAGTDYAAVTATAWSIAPGQPSTTVSVPVTGDTLDEANETFLVNLTALSNAAASGNDLQATGTITDDDAANGQLRMSECVAEISELVANIQLTVERVNGSNGAIGIAYATANGTALAGSDYAATSGTLSWPSGDTGLRTITVPLINSTAKENREDFYVNLSSPTGGATLITPSSSQVWILDGQDQVFTDGFDLVPPCN